MISIYKLYITETLEFWIVQKYQTILKSFRFSSQLSPALANCLQLWPIVPSSQIPTSGSELGAIGQL